MFCFLHIEYTNKLHIAILRLFTSLMTNLLLTTPKRLYQPVNTLRIDIMAYSLSYRNYWCMSSSVYLFNMWTFIPTSSIQLHYYIMWYLLLYLCIYSSYEDGKIFCSHTFINYGQPIIIMHIDESSFGHSY